MPVTWMPCAAACAIRSLPVTEPTNAISGPDCVNTQAFRNSLQRRASFCATAADKPTMQWSPALTPTGPVSFTSEPPCCTTSTLGAPFDELPLNNQWPRAQHDYLPVSARGMAPSPIGQLLMAGCAA